MSLIAVSPDGQQLIGVGSKGSSERNTTRDLSWRNIGTAHGSAQAFAITDAGDILIVDDSGPSQLFSTYRKTTSPSVHPRPRFSVTALGEVPPKKEEPP